MHYRLRCCYCCYSAKLFVSDGLVFFSLQLILLVFAGICPNDANSCILFHFQFFGHHPSTWCLSLSAIVLNTELATMSTMIAFHPLCSHNVKSPLIRNKYGTTGFFFGFETIRAAARWLFEEITQTSNFDLRKGNVFAFLLTLPLNYIDILSSSFLFYDQHSRACACVCNEHLPLLLSMRKYGRRPMSKHDAIKMWCDLSLRECECNCNKSHCFIAATLLVICQLPIRKEPNNNHSFEHNTRQLPSPFSIPVDRSIQMHSVMPHPQFTFERIIFAFALHYHLLFLSLFTAFWRISIDFFCVNFHKNRPDLKLTVILLRHTVIRIKGRLCTELVKGHPSLTCSPAWCIH